MNTKSPGFYLFGFAILVVAAVIVVGIVQKSAPSEYDSFAQCLTESGYAMYGAYWCPHCENQKAEFGNAFQYIDYVECATPGDPYNMKQECRDAGVEGYPTWIGEDGTFLSGDRPLENLAEETGCQLYSEEVEA